PSSSSSDQPDPKKTKTESFDIASIRAQIAARKAQVEAQVSSRPSDSPHPPSLPSKPIQTNNKIAAAKRRIEEMNAKMSNPYLGGVKPIEQKPQATGGLHPLLMETTNSAVGGKAGAGGIGEGVIGGEEKNEKKALRDRYKTMAPKYTSVKANASISSSSNIPRPNPVIPVLNPYATKTDTLAPEEEKAVIRKSKKLQFSQAGRYVKQGDALRSEIKMDELRQRIAEASKKAGLDSEFDTLERSLKRAPPPDVEWWDQAILPEGATYEDIDSALEWITTSNESLVTHLVQHPIPIPAPGEKKQPERGLMLTKREQKKMRRQRRQAELEDKRDRQKMGLLPPDPPKVRLANLMKVLTSAAIQDPTKVEAKVRKEVAMRALKHQKDNESRKLTPEQRKEKEYQKLVSKERTGLYCAVFKIKYLTNGRHKFKVRETAKTDLLSGVCIFGPYYAIVLVEGVDKSIKHYKRMMLHRIDWTEQARPLGDEGEDDDEDGGKMGGGQEDPDSLADNKCELIWEGEVPERTFRIFRARHAESDSKAKEWLTPKWEGMWDVAKRLVWSGEDV
ncbi:hypothetical protein TREMEDRAFT_13987, partial [Tremella mesenterica DSM 1558]|uniref:uncharacterized protein n=1 Tax=Tremella mesenterica (strain ATCC 24925 / CBS 8224 / DSM 1558 / NBRC 9311 / NRRL Y-6157 / RJB 2259-6 / UBC 559-6) TaxID=578456 RepID=UPI0003F4A12A